MSSLEKILQNNNEVTNGLSILKQELETIKNQIFQQKKHDLAKENLMLHKQVEELKTQLKSLEIKNGKKQISVPGESKKLPITNVECESIVKSDELNASKQSLPKEKKDKPPKKEKSGKENKTTTVSNTNDSEPPHVGMLDLRIGKIVEVSKHPDADSLYLEKIDCGEENPRTVISGLVKYVPIDEMNNRMVVVLCNLKPAKMRGITSEAMVMCASTPEKVEILIPPNNSIPGDLVHCKDYERNPPAQLNPKKKIFEAVAPDLKTDSNLIACYKNNPLFVPDKGNIISKTLKNVNIK